MNIYAMKKPKRINSVSVSLFAIALVVGYLGWAFIPIYWPIFQLQGIIRGACNEAYKNYDNEKVLAWLLKESRRTGLRLTKDNFRMRRESYSDQELQALTADTKDRDRAGIRDLYSRRGKTCVIEYRYKDTYELPLIGTQFPLTFQGEVRGSLETVSY